MKKTRLYLGLEIKVRELDAKILLACVAAEAGYEVVLGQQRLLKRRLDLMPSGIFLDKSVASTKAPFHRLLHKVGFQTAAYDAEGLAFYNIDEYKKRRLSPDTLNAVDYFFAWGERQSEIIAEKISAQKEKIQPVGHPRVDLTRREFRDFYKSDAEELRQRYGRFLLINTNFSLCNHARGKDVAIDVLARGGKIADEAHREYYQKLRDHKQRIFDEFVKMIGAIHTRFPEIGIVLRPHPAENHDYWREILPRKDNIHVVHEGNILPWLLAASVSIHNSCTTGIEGYLLERPVIAYQPVQHEMFDIDIANMLSERVFHLDALLEKLDLMLHGVWKPLPQDLEEKRTYAQHYISGLDGALASERIVDCLHELPPLPSGGRIVLSRSSHSLYRALQTVWKHLRALRPPPEQDRAAKQAYLRQKFPGLELEEVQQGVSKFQRLSGRFSHVQVVQLEENMFQIRV